MGKEVGRFFIGLDVAAPWPEKLPGGPLLQASDRHITLVFLGKQERKKVVELFERMPQLKEIFGFFGFFNSSFSLPQKKPRCIAWRPQFFKEQLKLLTSYQKELLLFFYNEGLVAEDLLKRPFLPHVTLCKSAKFVKEWNEAFTPLPFVTGGVNLYESLGSSRYQVVASAPLLPPFQPLQGHSYRVFGSTLKLLATHAFGAMAFEEPRMFLFKEAVEKAHVDRFDEVVALLNRVAKEGDGVIRAVSSSSIEEENGCLSCEIQLVC